MNILKVTPRQEAFMQREGFVGWMYLPPVDFLSVSVPYASVTEWIEEENGPHTKTVEQYNSFDSQVMMWLDIDILTGRVLGHEGRHRAIATINASGDKVPVGIGLRRNGQLVTELSRPAYEIPTILLGQFIVSRQITIHPHSLQSFNP